MATGTHQYLISISLSIESCLRVNGTSMRARHRKGVCLENSPVSLCRSGSRVLDAAGDGLAVIPGVHREAVNAACGGIAESYRVIGGDIEQAGVVLRESGGTKTAQALKP